LVVDSRQIERARLDGVERSYPSMKMFLRIIGIAFLVLSPVLLISAVVQFIMPSAYQSTARIVMPRQAPTAVSNTESVGFVQTPAEKLLSKTVLYGVITNLDLNRRWGEKLKEGPLPTDVTYLLLKREIEVAEEVRGSSLVEIRVRSDQPAEAAAIANEVARVYLDQERARWRAAQDAGISRLEVELTRAGNDLVRETLEKRIKAERAAAWTVPRAVPEIVDRALPDVRPVSPNPALKIVFPVAGVLSAVVGTVMLILGSFAAKPAASGSPPLTART
jgi:capsular polysaccharide biosynthesis protein